MNNPQNGAALVVSLVLLVIALLLGLSSMQTSRLEESMSGNYRSASLAHMAAEAGASRFFRHLRNEGWPESSTSGILVKGFKEDVGDYAAFEVSDVCWKEYPDSGSCSFSSSDDFVTARFSGLAEREEVVSRLVAKYRKMPGFADGAAYSCFGFDCSDSVGGNATLSGEDYYVPKVFDCQGSHCISDANPDGENQDAAYYPDAPFPDESDCDSYQEFTGDDGSVAYIDCDGRIYGVKPGYGDQDQWYDFLDFVEASGFDVILGEGDELDYNVGGRDDYDSSASDQSLEDSGFWDSVSPRFIEISDGAGVTVKASTNTLGVIVVRDGATLDYKGTSTHEGLILIEPGGTLKFSSGNPQVYGGVVALQSVSEDGEIITGELDISGNMGVRYSSLAFDMLRKGGKGIRLMSWYIDVSEPDS